MAVIARNNVIPGARNDDFHVDGLVHCDQVQPTSVSVTLDEAAVLALDATPVVLAAMPAGKKIVPLGVYYDKEAGAYTLGADITVNFTDGSDTLVATIPVAQVRLAGATTGWATRATLSGAPDSQVVLPDSIDMSTSTGFTATAGGDLTVTLLYLEVA